ncbi:MAG: DUF3322 domain-containing protein [Glutamicibacter arilaitensis]
MITVAEARERLSTLYRRKLAAWSVRPFDATSPVALGLKPPTDRKAAADMPAVAAWLKQWSAVAVDGLQIDWEQRRWPNTGTQSIPVRLSAQSPAALARFLNRGKEWELYRARALRLQSLAPRDSGARDVFDRALARIIGKAAALSQQDFERVFHVLAWLAAHPDSGLYPRQLPVQGIDSKWLERHADIVRTLHVATGGDPGLGLLAPAKLYRVRFLDPRLAPAGMGELMASPDTLSRLDLSARTVLIVENLQTLLSLPELPGVVALHGGGYDVRWCAPIPWVAAANLLYWGDLDLDGLAILASLRSVRPDARSVMMDPSTLQRFAQLAVPHAKGLTRAAPSGLQPKEVEAYKLLRAQGGLRFEQERIPWDHALATLRTELGR